MVQWFLPYNLVHSRLCEKKPKTISLTKPRRKSLKPDHVFNGFLPLPSCLCGFVRGKPLVLKALIA